MAILAAIFVIATLAEHGERRTGGSLVRSAIFLQTITPKHPELCIDNQLVPARTQAVRLMVGTYGKPAIPLHATLRDSNRTEIARGSITDYRDGDRVVIPLAGLKDEVGLATLCIAAKDARLAIAGEPSINRAAGIARLDKRTINGAFRIEYLFAGNPTVFSQIGNVLKRASLFKPGWVGPWTFYLLAAIALGMIGVMLFALLSDADQRWTRTGWLVVIGVVAFGNCLVWSLVTPAFQAPDEAAHYAYVDTLANRGRPAANPDESGKPSYSTRAARALEFTANAVVRNDQVSPPWRKAEEDVWKAEDARDTDGDKDAFGISPAATYSPIYYLPAVVPYKLSGGNTFDKLWAVRLYSILLTVGAALLAFLTARELMPRPTWFAPVAGLAVAFEPMFLHVGSCVNNDSLLFLCTTALLYVFARAFQRGITVKLAVAAGFLFALGFHVKPAMIGLAPSLLLAVVLLLLRSSGPPLRTRLKDFAAGAVALAGTWLVAISLVGNTGSDTATTLVDGPRIAPFSFSGLGTYTWEWYLPKLWFMQDWLPDKLPVWTYFFQGTVARFNHLDTAFPANTYWVLAGIAMAMLIPISFWAWSERTSWRNWLPVASVMVLAPVGLGLFITVSSYLMYIGGGGTFAQGRYLLPCITVFGLFVAAAARGFGENWGRVAGCVFVFGFALLNFFSLGLSLSRFYL